MSASVTPFFLPAADGGQRFCLHHRPAGVARRQWLIVPPFAEELNKCRRQFSLLGRALAARGHAVLLLDPKGCGDSSGDFGEVSWDDWVDDVLLGLNWLGRGEQRPVVLALRAGALTVSSALNRGAPDCDLVVWQPSLKGSQVLQQFLRLRLAASLTNGGERGQGEGLRRELAEGRNIDIAGYSLGGALAQGLETALFAPPAGRAGQRLQWLELASQPGDDMTPAARQGLQTWEAAGWQVHGRRVQDVAFWATTEIETAPALIDATLACAEQLA